MTEFGRLGLVGLAFYLLGLVALAFVARRARGSDSPTDHFLAGRELGVFVLFLTLYATAYSGNSLLGYPGEAYRRGFSWIMATGFMLSIIVAFHMLIPRLRPIAVRHRFVTPGDWVRYRFRGEPGGRLLLFGVSMLMTIALANFLFAQLKAMGELSTEVTGGVVSYEMGIALLAAMILFYETLGGMRAVAWTDAAQGILMMVGLAALAAWLLGEASGLAALSQQILAVRPEVGRVPDTVERTNWLSSIVLLGLASTVYPQAIQRVYAARDGRALKRSLAWMSFMPLTTTLVVTLIGLAAIPRYADLGEVAADRVMPLLLGQWASTGPAFAGAAVLVFLGALAAIMSTADSCLLSLGSSLAEDLFGRPRDAPSTTAFAKRAAGAVMIAMAVVAMAARDVTLWGLIELKMELLIQCVPAFLIAIRWRGFRATPAWIGLAVGSAIAIAGAMAGVKRIEGLHVGVIGLAVNLAIACLGSLMLGPAGVKDPGERAYR
ncbi:MAG: sodium:solute symporter family protein [Deltaproteobacteria bacterium]|nr:sodium:solute symporter family protein [Deltaproteobacteria bacterium]